MTALNIGAGSDIKAGMVNIDIRPLPGIDLVIDARKLPYEDNVVNKIIATDILEHFGRNEVTEVLKEWNRVLKPCGVLIIRTPSLLAIVEDYMNGSIDGWETCRRLFGNQDYPENTHKCIFDGATLKYFLEMCGFRIVSISQTEDRRNTMVRAVKES